MLVGQRWRWSRASNPNLFLGPTGRSAGTTLPTWSFCCSISRWSTSPIAPRPATRSMARRACSTSASARPAVPARCSSWRTSRPRRKSRTMRSLPCSARAPRNDVAGLNIIVSQELADRDPFLRRGSNQIDARIGQSLWHRAPTSNPIDLPPQSGQPRALDLQGRTPVRQNAMEKRQSDDLGPRGSVHCRKPGRASGPRGSRTGAAYLYDPGGISAASRAPARSTRRVQGLLAAAPEAVTARRRPLLHRPHRRRRPAASERHSNPQPGTICPPRDRREPTARPGPDPKRRRRAIRDPSPLAAGAAAPRPSMLSPPTTPLAADALDLDRGRNLRQRGRRRRAGRDRRDRACLLHAIPRIAARRARPIPAPGAAPTARGS